MSSPTQVARPKRQSLVMVENVRNILESKNSAIWSVTPDTTVYDALALMAEKGIGALLVMEQGRLVGVVSERDYARKVALQGKHSRDTQVSEIMTSPAVTVALDHTVEQCMEMMTDRRIRHLPVVVGSSVLGIVSIGDLVKTIISAQAHTIDQLSNYISGDYPG